jgi:tRNA modification GTPase
LYILRLFCQIWYNTAGRTEANVNNTGGTIINETIIAQASAYGSGVRSILRISGSRAAESVRAVVRSPDAVNVTNTSVIIETEITLPDFPPFPAKLFIWKNGHSYTGEETVEIHCIGSQVLLNKIIVTLLESGGGVRLAKPGEFTMRAFLSGRLDLTQAEAVLGVIEAASDADLKTALNQLAGNAATPLSDVWSMLFNLLTDIEAGLDFADEDITFIKPEMVRSILSDALQRIETLRQQMEYRGTENGKPRAVLAGLPNAGKSTLFNKLLGREAAIVSPQAGTTTDYLEGETSFGGIDCILIDTAGQSGEELSAMTLPENVESDVIIYCYENNPLSFENKNTLSPQILYYQTKRTDESIEELRQNIGERIRRSESGAVLCNTALRCKEAVIFASDALRRALDLTDESLIALEVRSAINHLGLINGTVHTADILEQIFSRFCIGK